MAIEEKGLAYYDVKYYFMFCASTRILPHRDVIYDIKQMINVRNPVGKSNLNYTIYITDSIVTETLIITEGAGNKVA
jgi:hypothetical protein